MPDPIKRAFMGPPLSQENSAAAAISAFNLSARSASSARGGARARRETAETMQTPSTLRSRRSFLEYFLCQSLLLVRCTGSRRTDKQSLAVREGNVLPVRSVRVVLGPIPLDQDFRSRGERVFREPASDQRSRWAALNHPAYDLAVRALDIDVDPGMGIDPFHPHDRAFQMDGLVGVEFRRERVMRHRGCRSTQHSSCHHDSPEPALHRLVSLLLTSRDTRRDALPGDEALNGLAVH